jgi:hypothetical protein
MEPGNCPEFSNVAGNSDRSWASVSMKTKAAFLTKGFLLCFCFLAETSRHTSLKISNDGIQPTAVVCLEEHNPQKLQAIKERWV